MSERIQESEEYIANREAGGKGGRARVRKFLLLPDETRAAMRVSTTRARALPPSGRAPSPVDACFPSQPRPLPCPRFICPRMWAGLIRA